MTREEKLMWLNLWWDNIGEVRSKIKAFTPSTDSNDIIDGLYKMINYSILVTAALVGDKHGWLIAYLMRRPKEEVLFIQQKYRPAPKTLEDLLKCIERSSTPTGACTSRSSNEVLNETQSTN
jgi:hypothetical protein